MRVKRFPPPEAVEISADDLQEFLEADALEVRADPAFKAELRERLFEMVLSLTPEWKTGRDESH